MNCLLTSCLQCILALSAALQTRGRYLNPRNMERWSGQPTAEKPCVFVIQKRQD